MFFTEWVQDRLNEGPVATRLAGRDYEAISNVSQETFERDQINPDNRVNYIVVTNAIALLKDLIKATKTGNAVDPDNYTSFRVESINGDRVSMTRNTNQTYSNGRPKVIGIDAIKEFEVTDAFKDNGVIYGNNNRYFLSAARKGSGNRLKELMQKWLGLTSHSAIGNTKEDRQDTAMSNFFGGEDAVKKKVNSGANDAKTKMWMGLGDRASRGEDITKIAFDAATDDTNGINRFSSDGFHGFVKTVAPDAYDQLRLKKVIGQVSPEEDRIVRTLDQIDKVVKTGMADQILSGNSEIDFVVNDENAVRFARIMGYPHAAQWISKNGDNGFYARINQQQQQAIDPRTMGQQSNQVQNQGAPMGTDPSPLEKLLQGECKVREAIKWRRNNDTKNYRYYC